MNVRRMATIAAALAMTASCASSSMTAHRSTTTSAATTSPTGTAQQAAAREIHFNVSTPPPVPLSSLCDTHAACLLLVKGPAFTATGDSNGTGVNAGAAYLLPGNGAIANALATFSGTVTGCGKGSVIVRYDAHYGKDQPGGGTGTWAYVDGTGHGGLAHITGGGTFAVLSTKADLTAVDRFTGTIHC